MSTSAKLLASKSPVNIEVPLEGFNSKDNQGEKVVEENGDGEMGDKEEYKELKEAEEHPEEIPIANTDNALSALLKSNNLSEIDWDTYKKLKTTGPNIESGIVK